MTGKRVILYGVLLVVSVIGSLLFTYIYGAFQHDRYWDGTISKVVDTEIGIIQGVASIVTVNNLTTIDNKHYKKMFDPLKGKVGVFVTFDGVIIYSNLSSKRVFDGDPISIENDNGLGFKIYRYSPPKWSFNYKRWITSINVWFTPRFDYITVPFLTALVINYLFLYALLWRYREKHMSRDVRQLLNKLGA